MVFFDRFLDFFELNDREEEYEDSEYYDDDEEDEEDEVEVYHGKRYNQKDSVSNDGKVNFTPKVTPIRNGRNKITAEGANMEVFSIKPTSLEDNGEMITKTLKANRTVIMNLGGLDNKVAQRIIDYASGSCYALDGKINQLSQDVFILTPANVDLTGDVQELEVPDGFGVQPLKDLY